LNNQAIKVKKLILDDWSNNIKIIGVGGAGCKAVDYMIDNGLTIDNGNFISADDDYEDLSCSIADATIALGKKVEEREIRKALHGAEMVVIVAGMGDDNVASMLSEIFRIADSIAFLTVGVVTIPLLEDSAGTNNALSSYPTLYQNSNSFIPMLDLAQV
jgi:cell division protein FtsZ